MREQSEGVGIGKSRNEDKRSPNFGRLDFMVSLAPIGENATLRPAAGGLLGGAGRLPSFFPET
jgi:hypothetical protein